MKINIYKKLNKNSARKGISPIVAGVFLVAILITTLGISTTILKPKMDSIKDVAKVEQATNSMQNLEQALEIVSREGTFSSKKVNFLVSEGTINIDSNENKIFYYIPTKSEVVSPRSVKQIKNLKITSNANVDILENNTHYIVENEHLKLIFNKYGSYESKVSFNSSSLLESMLFKHKNVTLNEGFLVKLNNEELNCIGYSYVTQTGDNLARGRIIYPVEFNITLGSYSADIVFTLETGSDFLMTSITNLRKISA
jgi:FlaG/FlaF family flagellin (archaellin)